MHRNNALCTFCQFFLTGHHVVSFSDFKNFIELREAQFQIHRVVAVKKNLVKIVLLDEVHEAR